jgi:hypothetical protein
MLVLRRKQVAKRREGCGRQSSLPILHLAVVQGTQPVVDWSGNLIHGDESLVLTLVHFMTRQLALQQLADRWA